MSEDYLAKNARPIKLKGGKINRELFTPFGLSIGQIDNDDKVVNNYRGVLPSNKYDFFLQNTQYKKSNERHAEKSNEKQTRKRKMDRNKKTKKRNGKTIL